MIKGAEQPLEVLEEREGLSGFKDLKERFGCRVGAKGLQWHNRSRGGVLANV